MDKIKINMYAGGLNVKGQGVGSAFYEQTGLVSEIPEFEMTINKKHKNKFDIRHVHTVNPNFFFVQNKKRINVCYVHFVPDINDGSLKMNKLFFSIYKRYVLKFYRKADEVVVVNPYFIKDLLNIGIPEDRVTYIPNYVSKENFHVLDENTILKKREEYGLTKEDYVVLGVGQTQTRKGIIDFCKVAEMNPHMKFIWAGGFSFGKITAGYDEIKKLIDNPPKNMTFLGIIDRSKMNALYNLSDVLFLPSFQELFPMTLLECINTEKPFVVRDLDLYKDIFLSPYIVGTNNEEFSGLLNRLKDDEVFLQQARQYSIDIQHFYSKEHVKELWRKYYLRIYDKYPTKTLAHKKTKK